MKIAFFADTYFPHITGVAVEIKFFYEFLKKMGHNVTLFAPSVPKYEDRDESIIRLPSFRILPNLPPQARAPLIYPSSEYKEVFSKDYELIHAHGSGFFSLLALIVGKIRKVPVIITFHTDWAKYAHYFFLITPGLINWFLKQMGNLADCALVPSEKMKQVLLKIGVKKPIEVIPGFIEIEKFENLEKGFLKSLLGLPTSFTILLSVGRFGKEKRFDFLIKSCKKVLDQKPNCHLVLVGEGPEKDNLKSLSKKLAIEKQVHLIGPVDYNTMPKVYADSDIFVFASDSETQGLVVLEAAASGLPLVLYDDPAFEGIAINNFNSILNKMDLDSFAESILKLLSSKEIRDKFSENSKRLAFNNFKPEDSLNKLIKLYQKTKTHLWLF